ncbi:MAG: hypothetical protein WBA57_23450 [Elainellaceae cyanobacterium]
MAEEVELWGKRDRRSLMASQNLDDPSLFQRFTKALPQPLTSECR